MGKRLGIFIFLSALTTTVFCSNKPVKIPETWEDSETGRSSVWKTLNGDEPLLFAHQGEKILFPAHTLPAYEGAAILGADYVEPDLALTKDGVLVCYHDVTLKGGTDVTSHPELEYLKRNYSGIIGVVYEEIVDDWFIRDLTLAQIRTLRVKQRPDGVRLQYFNNDLGIPTFTEFLETIHRVSWKLNRTVGIIPELKHPSFHNENRPPRFMEDLFLIILRNYGYAHKKGIEEENCRAESSSSSRIPCPPVIIQNFDKSVLEYLRTRTDMDLMMVVHPEVELLTYKALDGISKFAQYYCVWKEYMYVGVETELAFSGIKYDPEVIYNLGGFIPGNSFPVEAHARGLRMALFTIPDSRENSRRGCAIVPGCEPSNKVQEMFYYFDLGVDALFAENVAENREIRSKYEPSRLLETRKI